MMRELTLAELDELEAQAGEANVAFDMDEAAFRAFYERTARPLWAYLVRMTGDPHAADDLLQESYYRLLRAEGRWEGEAHRRAYLFRIATNLVRDRRRRDRHRHPLAVAAAAPGADLSHTDAAEALARRADVHRAMAQLRPRERALLWLAYAHGHPHVEIARILGVKPGSVKLLLFRARRRLAGLLRGLRGGSARATN